MEGVGPSPGPVDELIDDHELAGMDVGAQRAARARADHRPHSERCERPDVGAERNPVRRELVLPAVAGEEGDPTSGQVAHGDRRRRVTERGGHLDLDGVGQEVVEAGASDDPDLRSELGRPIAEWDQHGQELDEELDDEVVAAEAPLDAALLDVEPLDDDPESPEAELDVLDDDRLSVL